MKLVRLYSMPQKYAEQFESMLGCEYSLTIKDIETGQAELYELDNCLVCLKLIGEQCHIINLVGERLDNFVCQLVKLLKAKGVKELVAHTKRAGMKKYIQSIGGVLLGQYDIYSLEI